jgi:protein N-terminal methyltransferase
MGLESWDPSTPYDLIWNQWCLGHLTDVQLQNYLQKCAKALKTGGWIIVKENMSTNGLDVFDELDSSVTRYVLCHYVGGKEQVRLEADCDRTDGKFRDIFESAGLVLKKTEIQRGLPPELYPVRIYALQPKTP